MQLWRSRFLAIVSGSALLVTACTQPARTPPPSAPRHVILISIDTLRADHLGAYGSSSGATPFLDSLAKDGVLFERQMSNSNNTLSSHASILTGLVPLAHGTHDGGSQQTRSRLIDEFDTLPERMRESGYTSAAFTAHPAWLGRSFGLDQGFDRLESEWWGAPELSRSFLRWLDAEAPSHLFAFLHFYDVHSDVAGRGASLPYTADAQFIERFAGPRPPEFTGTVPGKEYQCCTRWMQAANQGEVVLSDNELRYVHGLYTAGLAQFDRDLAVLFGELRRRGFLDGALIVVTSDHGEEFWEHGQLMHGGFHEEVVRVPLIIVPPLGMTPRARTISAMTRSIDIAPTIAEFVGAPGLGSGRSLLPGFRDGATLPDGEVLMLDSLLRANDASGPFLYAHDENQPRFWDLRSDPGELGDLLAGDPDEAVRTRVAAARTRILELQRTAREFERRTRASAVARPVELSAEQAEQLNQLGYAGR